MKLLQWKTLTSHAWAPYVYKTEANEAQNCKGRPYSKWLPMYEKCVYISKLILTNQFRAFQDVFIRGVQKNITWYSYHAHNEKISWFNVILPCWPLKYHKDQMHVIIITSYWVIYAWTNEKYDMFMKTHAMHWLLTCINSQSKKIVMQAVFN